MFYMYMYVHVLPLFYTAISTAALEMLAGDVGTRMSRKPDIMADAAYLILSQNSRDITGQFLIDDDVLRQHGVTDLDQYANVPGQFFKCVYCTCLNNNHEELQFCDMRAGAGWVNSACKLSRLYQHCVVHYTNMWPLHKRHKSLILSMNYKHCCLYHTQSSMIITLDGSGQCNLKLLFVAVGLCNLVTHSTPLCMCPCVYGYLVTQET